MAALSLAGSSSRRLQTPDFEVLFESMPGSYLVLSPDFHIVAATELYLRATLSDRSEIVGRRIFDVYPDSSDRGRAAVRRSLRRSLKRVLRAGVPDVMPVRKYDIRRPQSQGGGFEERYWKLVNAPVRANDKVIYIIHRIKDVTESVRRIERQTSSQRMEAEIIRRAREIQRINHRLRQAHEELEYRFQVSNADLALANERVLQLAAIVESSEDAIVGRALDGTITSWNKSAERLYGYAAEDMVGQCAALPGPADGAGEFANKIKLGDHVPSFETVRRHKDGRSIHVSVSISPIRDCQGRIAGSAEIARDISDRKHLEQQLNRAQKLKAIGQLAGGVAHDFNNLLTVIFGCSELLLRRLGADDPSARPLQEIYKAGERAASLTRQLLAFSRKQILEPKILNLNMVVHEVESMLGRLIGEDIALTVMPGGGLGEVKADAGQIEQVIMNLAVNARDAMPRGGKLTIETKNVELDATYSQTEVQPGRYVMLAVSDTGRGMDEKTCSCIFEPFFTTKEPGKGTGLGLATVYGIVRQSGGHIFVYSEPDKGTTFKILLPRVMDESAPAGSPLRCRPAAHGTETVLLVEDETAVRALSRTMLQNFGYTVLEAGNGPEAIHVCERHDGIIHLLVSDVVMPEMSGRQLVERLAVLRPGLKILYLSGYTDDAIVRHGVLDEETAFLQKPFTPTALASKVREVLDAISEVVSGGYNLGGGQ